MVDARGREMGSEEGNGDLVFNGESFSLGKWKIQEMHDGEFHNNVKVLSATELYS